VNSGSRVRAGERQFNGHFAADIQVQDGHQNAFDLSLQGLHRLELHAGLKFSLDRGEETSLSNKLSKQDPSKMERGQKSITPFSR
jgi:hypothetical protein